MNIEQLDKANIWHPFSHYDPESVNLVVDRAKDEFLYDPSGKAYIDSTASWWVNLHGHGNEKIAQRIYEQALKLEHVIFAGCTHQPAVELSQRLLNLLPDNQEKLFYSDNGSTATEIALKLAVQSFANREQPRTTVLALDGAYHGDTVGAMSAGDRGLFTRPFDDLLFDVVRIPFPTEANASACIKTVQEAVETGNVAAFIFEPLLQAAGGMRIYSAELLDQLVGICQQAGVVTIADEVVTAFYRTGPFLATDRLTHIPDIICMAKGVTGGTMAMGVTSCSAAIYEHFKTEDRSKTFYHGHSFTGNPIACTAAVASLEILESDASKASRDRIAQFFASFSEELKAEQGVEQVRTLGQLLAFDVQSERTGYLSNIRDWLYQHYLDQGILMRPLGNTVVFLPPYCTSNASLNKLRDVTLQLLKVFRAEYGA